jgi:hypothetical protein
MDQEYEVFWLKTLFHSEFPIGVNASDTGLYLIVIYIFCRSAFILFWGNPWIGVFGIPIGSSHDSRTCALGKIFNPAIGARHFTRHPSWFHLRQEFLESDAVPLISILMGFLIYRIYSGISAFFRYWPLPWPVPTSICRFGLRPLLSGTFVNFRNLSSK